MIQEKYFRRNQNAKMFLKFNVEQYSNYTDWSYPTVRTALFSPDFIETYQSKK